VKKIILAPSGTTYSAVISASCYDGAAPQRKSHRRFKFQRYKGNLTIE
jgi:hypothetical protein